jgi:beta-lactamase class A
VITFGVTGIGQQAARSQLNLLLAAAVPRGGFHLLGLTNVEPTSLEAVTSNASDEWRITVRIDPRGAIDGLSVDGVFWTRPPPPTSWAQLDQRLDDLAPQASFLAAQVSSGGQCRTIHAVAPDVPRPLASMFKLYVLGALGTQIARGQVAWNQPVAIQENLKSLPTPSPLNQLPRGPRCRSSSWPARWSRPATTPPRTS